jgi:protein-tyrosine-phosphatase
MAVGVLRRLLPPDLLPRVEIDSAGVNARDGDRASEGALEAAGSHGVDISRHRAKKLTRALLQRADLILVMERAHMDRLREMCPSRMEHVMLLTELGRPEGGGSREISDPIGGSTEVYRRCFSQIEISLARGEQFLTELIQGGSR